MADLGEEDHPDVSLPAGGSNVTYYYAGVGQEDVDYPDDNEKFHNTAAPGGTGLSPNPIFLNNNHSATATTPVPVLDIYEANSRQAASFLPVFVALGCIIVLGVLCNIIVCYIYRCRSRRATSNFFVIFFAIIDMVGCLIGIPLEIIALALPYTYEFPALCKMMGFIETLSVCTLCLTLVCVAYDCYRKHCKPPDGCGVKKARNSCIVSIVIAVFLSIPAFFVFDTSKELIDTSKALFRSGGTPTPLYGTVCSIKKTLPRWPWLLYYSCILATFLCSFVAMFILYCMIVIDYWKKKQADIRGEKSSSTKRSFPKKHRFVREDTSSSSANYTEEISRLNPGGDRGTMSSTHSNSDLSSTRVPLKSSSGSSSGVKSTSIVKTNSLQATSAPPAAMLVQLNVKHTRQFSIFLVIFVGFFLTMLPFVVVTILCMVTDVFNQFSSSLTEIAFNLCVRSYLLNYVVKPVVYFFFNLNFRKEVKHLFSTIWSVCTRSGNDQQTQSSRQLQRSFTMGSSSRSTSRVPIYRPKHSM